MNSRLVQIATFCTFIGAAGCTSQVSNLIDNYLPINAAACAPLGGATREPLEEFLTEMVDHTRGQELLFSDGGTMDREIGVRSAAGFGSQIAMVAYHRRAMSEGRLLSEQTCHRWLDGVSGRSDAGLEVVHLTLRWPNREEAG